MRSLFEERSLLDRVRRQDHRFVTRKQIADSREVRIVPDLLPFLAADETLAPHVAAVIAERFHDVTAGQLSWPDEGVRDGSDAQYWSRSRFIALDVEPTRVCGQANCRSRWSSRSIPKTSLVLDREPRVKATGSHCVAESERRAAEA